MDLKLEVDEDHTLLHHTLHSHHIHLSHHDALGPLPLENHPSHDHCSLEYNDDQKKSSFDDFHDEDEDDDSLKRRRKILPPPKKLNEDQWTEMFLRLIRYKELHGDCLVPKRYQEDPKLGTWVETQRVQYKKLLQQGDSDAITPNNRLNAERLGRLESVGFAWSAKNLRKIKPTSIVTTDTPPIRKRPMMETGIRFQARQRLHDQTWAEMYERLEAYKQKYGDCLVPKKYEEDPKLASWIETQRVLYNRDYKMTETRLRDFHRESPDLGMVDPSDIKSPEEWAMEMDKGTPATEEDAAEVAATMAEAAMEVVNDVVAPMDDIVDIVTGGSDTDAGLDSQHGDDLMSDSMLQLGRRLSHERKEKLDALGFVWSLRSKRVDDHWDQMFHQLKEYKARHGDCLVPSRYEENYKLGKWVETQRYEYTKLQRASSQVVDGEEFKLGSNPRLTPERRARLEAIGFEWKVKHKMKRYYDRQWDSMFEKLLQFKAENGHCLVPKRYPPDAKLGTWVHTQRIQFRKIMMISEVKKERTAGTEDEIRLEEEEKLKAERQLAQDEADMKAAVESLVKDENDGNLEDVKSADRQAAEDQYFRLTDERRRRLDEVGFVWCVRDSEKNAEPNRISRNSYDDQWDSMFLRLKEYKERHGHCLVPKRCKEDPKLGTWVDTQRVQYKKMRKKLDKEGLDYVPPTLAESILNDSPELNPRKPLVGRLTDDRIRRLEGLGFVWSLRDDWQKHYEELLQYKQEHGHCNVPARYASNRRLGIWVSAQRQQYKQISSAYEEDKPRRPTPLTQERIDQLNALGFTWTIRSRDNFGESWNQKFEELKEYRAQYGNCLVPSRYPPNPELGIWVGTQRTQYRLFQEAKESGSGALQGTSMNEDRIRQLEELGFVWALRNGIDTTWRKHIPDLLDFRANHGHCCVPANYKRNPLLGEWATAIRFAYLHRDENGLLDDEQVNELNSLGFSWLEPSPEFADTINNEVTTSISVDVDHVGELDDDDDVQIFHNQHRENNSHFHHSDSVTTLHLLPPDNLLHDGMDQAEL